MAKTKMENIKKEIVKPLDTFILLASLVAAASALCVIDETNNPNYLNFYTIPIPNGLEFVFSVKAAAYARLVLRESTGSRVIQINLGDLSNTESNINGDDGTILDTDNTCGLLSDEEFRTFWLKYASGVVQVGAKDSTTPLLTATIPGVDVDTAEFSSKVVADWIYDPDGAATTFSTTSFTTPYTIDYPAGSGVGSSYHFNFTVQAESDALLMLTNGTNPDDSTPVYEILLGAEGAGSNPMYTAIRRAKGGPDLHQQDTPNILNNTPTCFVVDIIQRDTSTVQIRKAGEAPFFTWEDTGSKIEINFYAIASNKAIFTAWKFPCDC